MIHSIVSTIDRVVKFSRASSHCDIPCKIYDPTLAQIAVLSTIRFMDLIAEIEDKDKLSVSDHALLVRLVREKEIHSSKVKEEIQTIWGDYFKQPQFELFPETNVLVHSIMVAASSCKQHIQREQGEKLLQLVNEFARNFWKTKGIETYSALCPYPPNSEVVYPRLG